MGKIYEFEKIEPKEVLKWFKLICSIPHGSFKETALAQKLKTYLVDGGCKVHTLSSGALYIQQKATYGHDNWPTVLLQGHLDMVQVKDDGVVIDFDKDPIRAYYDTEKGWLKAEGTTLGADNGVAIGMFMEVLTNPKIEHGPLEALFTVGEEANTEPCMKSIPDGLLNATYYINLDSDHDNTIFYASAGAGKLSYKFPLIYSKPSQDVSTYEIDFQKFSGGHSALIVHNPHMNAITFACKALFTFADEVSPIRLVSIDGGAAINSIPTWCKVVVQVKNGYENKLHEYVNEMLDVGKVVTQGFESTATFNMKQVNNAKVSLDVEQTNRILSFYTFIPNDMMVVNDTGKKMFNSSNVGVVKTLGDVIEGLIMPRSYYKPDLDNLIKLITIYAKNHGASEVNADGGCSGWLTPNFEQSRLINLWKQNYIKVVGSEPLIRPNPGGLEVAEIVLKNNKMLPNAMSTGPIIFKEHSIFENCPVESIKKIWTILQLTLKGLDK